MQRQAWLVRLCSVLALMVSAFLPAGLAKAAQAPPCHPANSEDISGRGDIVNLPADLKARLIELANRPHTYVPLQAFAEADSPSQLFQYYLLDTTGFEPNVFTAIIPGVNDGNVQLTVTGGIAACPQSAPCASCWSPNLGFRPIPRIPAPSSISSPISLHYSSSTTRAAGTKGG